MTGDHCKPSATERGSTSLVAALVSVVCAVALLVASPARAQFEGFGEGFGPADASPAPAFPGPQAAWAGTCDLFAANVAVGVPPGAPRDCIDHGTPRVGLSAETWDTPPSWRLLPLTPAGARSDGTVSIWMTRFPGSWGNFAEITDGDTKDIAVKLPPGVIGNPNAVPFCRSEQLRTVPTTCPPQTQVGIVTATLSNTPDPVTQVFPIYNAEPRDGKTAEFLVGGAGTLQPLTNIPIVAHARTDGDFGIDARVRNLPGGVPVLSQTVTFWAVPWASSHDRFRAPAGYDGYQETRRYGGMPVDGLPDPAGNQPQSYQPDWGPIRPFIANPTECAPTPPLTEIQLTSWQDPGTVLTTPAPADSVATDCAGVPFDVDMSIEPTSSRADAATGLDVALSTPQVNDPPADVAADPDEETGAPAYWASPDGRATAHLDRAVVTLPEGFSVNPSGAAGLAACSDESFGLVEPGNPPRFNNADPFDGAGAECPPGSKLGTVEVLTPILPATDADGPDGPRLSGDVVLGEPRSTDPTSGQMFRLFLVVRNRTRGLVAKIAGSAVADPATGQLRATFDKNPRVPFETMRLRFKGGERATLATPHTCGTRDWMAVFTPWTADHSAGGQAVSDGAGVTTAGRCGHAFAPSLTAGLSEPAGRASGTFSFEFSRADGEQWFRTATAEMPAGLLASLKGIPLCSNAQAAANACPSASRVGYVDAAAGAGDPFVLERKGAVYLTESYKGAPYGLAVSVPVEAGPFRGRLALDPIVVRQALHVDRTTAQVTAVSDPLPLVWHGIPLRARRIAVVIDRPGFMLNPSDCSPKRIQARLGSSDGVTATPSVPFQATGCGALPFKPKLALRLTGRRQLSTGGHPSIRARVTQAGVGEAGIGRARVRLPGSLALDPNNAQALCEFDDGTKPDLEDRCPRGSVIGRARAVTPLLDRPLSGDVYFVKNIRVDPDTGNQIRTLPMLVVALRGEIAVNLRGVSSVDRRGRLVNTFASVPDAPITRFDLNIEGGRNGILVVTRNRRGIVRICRKPRQIAEAKMDGHNGRRFDRNIKIQTPCRTRRGAGARARKGRKAGKRLAVSRSARARLGARSRR